MVSILSPQPQPIPFSFGCASHESFLDSLAKSHFSCFWASVADISNWVLELQECATWRTRHLSTPNFSQSEPQPDCCIFFSLFLTWTCRQFLKKKILTRERVRARQYGTSYVLFSYPYQNTKYPHYPRHLPKANLKNIRSYHFPLGRPSFSNFNSQVNPTG